MANQITKEAGRSWVDGFRDGENMFRRGLKTSWHDNPETHFNPIYVAGYFCGYNNVDSFGVSLKSMEDLFECEFGSGSWSTYILLPINL